ncbi:MAG: alpha/beta hydrolase-fold protein, partial [Myxococcota bacterium]
IEVYLDQKLPPPTQLFLEGDTPALRGRDHHGIPLHPREPHLWSLHLDLPRSTHLSFRIHRGNERTLALDANGRPLRWEQTFHDTGLFVIQVDGWLDQHYQPDPTMLGTLDIHRQLTYDGIQPRDVLVWLPPNYQAQTQQRYPVLYMHDGQNLFDPTTSYVGIDWEIDQCIQQLTTEQRIQTPIVVALQNTSDRLEEYAPTPKGYAYMDFIVQHVKPFVDQRYRTLPRREHTATMGSSMGGLAAFLLAWCHDQTFSKAACLSPVFLNEHDPQVDVCQWVDDFEGTRKDIQLYIDNGEKDVEYKLMPGCKRMLKNLQKRGYQIGRELEWFLDQDAHHHEGAWAARAWRPISFLFPRTSN